MLERAAQIEPTFIFNSEGRINIPFDRNPLSLVLVDLLPKYFGDLHGDPASTEMLKECFVSDSPVRQALEAYDIEGQDESPSKTITAVSPVMHFYSLPQVSEKLDAVLGAYLAGERAKYFQVMVGRVGIGKTTFLNHFFTIHKKKLMDEHFVLRVHLQPKGSVCQWIDILENAPMPVIPAVLGGIGEATPFSRTTTTRAEANEELAIAA